MKLSKKVSNGQTQKIRIQVNNNSNLAAIPKGHETELIFEASISVVDFSCFEDAVLLAQQLRRTLMEIKSLRRADFTYKESMF